MLYLLESMGLNLSDTSVSYIEVGATLQTDKEPKSYFNCLGRLPYFTKQTTYKSTTLYYNTPKTMNKSIIFYDKRKQIENKREARYKDQEHGIKGQYLRYELRMLKKSIREDKRIKSISTLQDLLDRNKYECLINRWQDYYLKIKKTKERPQRESELQGKITKAVQAHLKNTQIINR